MKRLITLWLCSAAALFPAALAGQSQAKQPFELITQKGGKTLGYSPTSGVKILTVDGLKFKDLNRNGRLDAYEDWRHPRCPHG